MRFYATAGTIDIITKNKTCSFFHDKKRAITPDEALSFFNQSDSILNQFVFLYENYDDAKVAAASLAASVCDIGSENKFLKPKTITTPIFVVEIPDQFIAWQNSNIKFTSDVERKVASYFGVKNLDAEKTVKNFPCFKQNILSVISVEIFHPYFRHEVIQLANTQMLNQTAYTRP